ncbi:MAG: carboxypeptidase-like regulatory domain-containing protein, partial [Acidobacteriota bacterium]
IEGALVALSASAMPEGVSAIPAPIEHDPERATRSGTDGIFEITGLLPGEVSLEVRAQGFQPSTRRHFEIVEGSLFDDLEVVLERGAVLEGLVTTAEGEPVEDALVAVGSSMASSGADGSFRVEGIATGQHTADARHPHFDRLQQKVEIEPGTNLLDFVFASAHRLAGRVVDERRSPVADARVELVISSRNDYREPHTLSDGQGRFDFPRLSAGTYRLQVEKEGWVADPPQLRIDLRGDDVDDLEVVLIPSIQLTGEVLGLDFTELAGVQVEAVTDDGQRRAGTVAYDGRYEIRDLGPGDWLVSAEAAEGTRRVETRLVLDPGDLEAYRDLEFEPGLVLSGRVEHGGEPVGAATIALLGSDVAARRDVLTDHDGQFRFEALESGSYRLSVSSSRDLFIHNEDVLLETDRDLLIELATAGLSGRVVAEDGSAIHRALVILQQRLPIADSGAGGEGSIFTVGSDSEGSFRFDRLPAGRFSVRIRKDGYAQLDEELELVAGGASEARTFTLEPTGGVELHLRLASGAVPPAALVTLLDDGGRPVQSEARGLAGGAARFETLQAGEWRALVGARGGAPREVRLTVPGDPVEIVLPDAGRLRVRVPDLFESPHRATVTLEDAGGQPFVGLDPGGMPQHTWSVDRGTATIEGVPAGQWILRLVGSGGGERTAAVATPGTSEVEVVF